MTAFGISTLRRRSATAVFVLAAGCSTLPSSPADPALVSITAAPSSLGCGDAKGMVLVELVVRNDSRGTLRFWISGQSREAPYQISWHSYDVLKNGYADWRHGPGGHGPLGSNILSIGPDDSAQVLTEIYSFVPEDRSHPFQIQVEDTADNKYTTTPFVPCS